MRSLSSSGLAGARKIEIAWGISARNVAAQVEATWAELLGFLTGLVTVWLVVRQHIANWPVGIANVLLLMVVFQHVGLYGDAWLQVSLIPETLERTTLGEATTGRPVNLEVDVLAKYVERLAVLR